MFEEQTQWMVLESQDHLQNLSYPLKNLGQWFKITAPNLEIIWDKMFNYSRKAYVLETRIKILIRG